MSKAMDLIKKRPFLLLGLPMALGLLFVKDRMIQMSEDGASHMLLAKSLWAGTGYRSIWVEGAPVHVHFPPLMPLLLAPVGGVFGRHFLPAHLLMWLAFGAGLWLGYRLLRRRMSALPAAAWTAYVATSPLYLQTVGAVNTENLYTALSLAGLLLLEGDGKNARNWAAALFLFALAFLTRSIGFTAFIAAGIYALIGKNGATGGARAYRTTAALGAGAILMAAWSLWTKTGAGGRTYFQELMLKDPYAAEPVRATAGDLLARFGHNLVFYGGELVALLGYEAGAVRKLSPVLFAAGCAVVLIVVFLGWLRWTRSGRSAAALYLPIYFGPILLWSWQYTRFLMPVLLLTGVCFAEGFLFIGEMALGSGSKARLERALCVAASILILGNVVGVIHDLRQPQPPPIAHYFEVNERLGEMARPGDIVVCRKVSVTGLMTGLKTRALTGKRGVEQVLALAEGAHWLIVDKLDAEGRASAQSAIVAYPERFELAVEAGSTRLYRIIPPGGD